MPRRDRRNDDEEFDEKPIKTAPKSISASGQHPKSRVEVHQPTTEVWDYENHWQKDFVDCCDDCKMCAFAFFCPPCFVGKLFSRTNECCCLCMCPCAMMGLRTKLRTGFRIKGSIFKDCMAATCCPLCAAIQMTQELDKQEL